MQRRHWYSTGWRINESLPTDKYQSFLKAADKLVQKLIMEKGVTVEPDTVIIDDSSIKMGKDTEDFGMPFLFRNSSQCGFLFRTRLDMYGVLASAILLLAEKYYGKSIGFTTGKQEIISEEVLKSLCDEVINAK